MYRNLRRESHCSEVSRGVNATAFLQPVVALKLAAFLHDVNYGNGRMRFTTKFVESSDTTQRQLDFRYV